MTETEAAIRYRQYAEQLREIADYDPDPKTSSTLRRIADECQAIADTFSALGHVSHAPSRPEG